MANKYLPKISLDQEGLLFLSLMTVISATVIGYMSLWGYANNSLQAGFVSIIFGFLLLAGLVFMSIIGRDMTKQGFNLDTTFRKPVLFYMIGVILSIILVSLTKRGDGYSVFSLPRNDLFSTFVSQMPRIGDFYVNTHMAPLVEELIFLIVLPAFIIFVFNVIGTKYPFFKNKYFQLAIIVLIAGVLFALFHTSKQITSFLVAAFLFRMVLIVLYWGDYLIDFIPKVAVLASLDLGIHTGNNWAYYGVGTGFSILTAHWAGIALILLYVIFLVVSIDYIVDRMRGQRA